MGSRALIGPVVYDGRTSQPPTTQVKLIDTTTGYSDRHHLTLAGEPSIVTRRLVSARWTPRRNAAATSRRLIRTRHYGEWR